MAKTSNIRQEKDFLGSISIPSNAYFGSHTMRALENFNISGLTAPKMFTKAIGTVKLSALLTNYELGLIKEKEKNAMQKAINEFLDGKFDNQFITDVFQAGAGTNYNMNINEIIANRANELLGKEKGSYSPIHPNNHVNMAQSSNDIMPTATRVAVLNALPQFLKEIIELEKTIEIKQKKYANTLKVGRTHLQDAVPISFGQEFDSYKQAISSSRIFIENMREGLKILGIGGTAVGTGITADPKYKPLMIKNLSKLTKINFTRAKNSTEIANNMTSFLNLSAGLRSLAINILNMCSDIKLMNMGPKAGISEIILPAVQPGSSIMPGKVNPSILEATEMVMMQVLGNDKTIELACQKSQFELNVYCPLIMQNLLYSIEIFKNAISTLNNKCLKGLEVNIKRTSDLFENSLCMATALVPHIGYELTAEIVKSALQNNISIKEEVIKRKMFPTKKLQKIFSIEAITNPMKI